MNHLDTYTTTSNPIRMLAVAAAAAAALAACGSSPQEASSTGTGHSPGAPVGASGACSMPGAASCFNVTLSISGAETFSGRATVPNDHGCATVLAQKASSNSGEVALGAALSGADGSAVTLSITLDHFNGPGQYTQANNDVYVDILLGDSEFNPQFSTATMTITASAQPSGSVSVAFAGLNSNAGSQAISGQAEFKCQDA